MLTKRRGLAVLVLVVLTYILVRGGEPSEGFSERPPEIVAKKHIVPSEVVKDDELTSYRPFNETGPCAYIADHLIDLPMPRDINHAFSMVVTRGKPIPRAYLMTFETFFKHNPSMTLYIYGDVAEIDPRFAERGFKLVLVPLNLTDLIEKLVVEIPDIKWRVFEDKAWTALYEFMHANLMVMADFVRLSLVFLHGGSWLDADGLVLRPFTWRNALPCFHYVWTKHQLMVMCTEERTVKAIYHKSNYVPTHGLNCANSPLGGFAKKHPFIRKALLGMARAWKMVDVGLKLNVLGTHLLMDTLIYTNNNATKYEKYRISLFEWPNIYYATRMLGDDVDPGAQLKLHKGNVSTVLADLEQRKVWTMHIYNWHYKSADGMRKLFSPEGFMWPLWQKNCIFSCDEALS